MLTATVDDMVPDGPPARANPARGVALIATALILGLFVLRQGFETIDGGESAADTGPSAEQTDDGDGGGAGPEGESGGGQPPATEAPQDELLPASELTVRVANTTSVPGAAAGWSNCLAVNGYQTVKEHQAAGGQQDLTTILYGPGLDQEAAELAAVVGSSAEAVSPVPAEPPASTDGQSLMANGAQLLVMLGADRAEASC